MPDTASLSCISVSLDSIVATWLADTVASSCEVNINSTGWVTPNDGLNAHIISALLPNQTVQIQVRCSNGDCIGFEELVYCATPSCNLSLSANVINDSTVTGNGSIEIITSNTVGGTYSYIWTNGMIGDSISNLFPGTYTCVVTDPNGCSAMITVNIAGVVNVDKYEFVNVNNKPGLVLSRPLVNGLWEVETIFSVDMEDEQITKVYAQTNPDKFRFMSKPLSPNELSIRVRRMLM